MITVEEVTGSGTMTGPSMPERPRLPGYRRLAEIRQSKVLSQEQLADLAGIRRATVSNIERGTQMPMPSTLQKLARALGMPPERLWRELNRPD